MTALLRIIAGLGFWAIGFSLLYAVHGLACARGWSAIALGPLDLQRVLLAALWIAACLGLLWWVRAMSRAPRDAERPLLGWLARASAITGLVSMLLTGVPVLLLRQCDGRALALEPGWPGRVEQAQGSSTGGQAQG